MAKLVFFFFVQAVEIDLSLHKQRTFCSWLMFDLFVVFAQNIVTPERSVPHFQDKTNGCNFVSTCPI
jgi:hypothetical protein